MIEISIYWGIHNSFVLYSPQCGKVETEQLKIIFTCTFLCVNGVFAFVFFSIQRRNVLIQSSFIHIKIYCCCFYMALLVTHLLTKCKWSFGCKCCGSTSDLIDSNANQTIIVIVKRTSPYFLCLLLYYFVKYFGALPWRRVSTQIHIFRSYSIRSLHFQIKGHTHTHFCLIVDALMFAIFNHYIHRFGKY